MKLFSTILAAIALLLLFCMLTCGLWTAAKGLPDMAAKLFHKQLGIATMVVSMVAIVLLLIRSLGK